jgi:regulator of sirC expression with transglutaminase-like and TPR domain
VDHYLDRLTHLTRQVKNHMPVDVSGRAAVEALLSILRDGMGFRGNVANYYDPANSFLHRVLDRRLGLPITLSLLYMAVGHRLGIRLEGMGFPAHFMLRYEDDDGGSWLLDPFYGELTPTATAEEYLSQILRQRIDLQQPLDLYRVTTTGLILRLLNNLRAVYLSTDAYEQASTVLDFMLMVAPEEDTLWRERGLLRFRAGQFLGAENDLRHFFYRRQQLRHFIESRPIGIAQPFMPLGEDATSLHLSGDLRELLPVIEHIRTVVARLN